MKHRSAGNNVTALLLSLVTATAGIGCITTAYAITVENWLLLVTVIALFCLLCIFTSRIRFGGFILFAIFCAVCLLTARGWLSSLERLLYTISAYCNTYYHWGIIRWSTTELSGVSFDPALWILGSLVAGFVCRTVCRRKWIGLALLAALLPLAACCITTGTVPDAGFIIVLLICLLLLTMTQLTRRQDEQTAARLTALLLIPVMLFSFLLVGGALKDPRKQEAQTTLNQLLNLVENPGNFTGGLINITGAPAEKVDLTALGPRDPDDQQVMTVEANHTGLIYLRGRSYDTYTGTNWTCQQDTANEGGWPTGGMRSSGTVYLSTVHPQSLRYFPYYVQNADWITSLSDGGYANPNRKTSYSFQWMQPSGSSVTYRSLSEDETEVYTDLPVSTKRAAQTVLSEIRDGSVYSNAVMAQKIAAYVRNSAAYDLDTPAMPEDAEDFAIWFLQNSDTGYCVHFASAATVLLRAAGIPARYVSGYITYTIPNVEVSVTGEQAHAWVEYLDPERGWTVLEATPGASSIPPVPTEPSAPATTEPSETTPPATEPEDSMQTTQPTEGTMTTRPANANTTPTQTPETPPMDTTWIRVVIWILLVCALLWMQYGLRRRLRQQRLNQGSPNKQALRRWKYVRRLAWFIGQDPPKNLLALAEKAAFSQHRLTTEELQEFDHWILNTHQVLLSKPWPVRILLRLILAI